MRVAQCFALAFSLGWLAACAADRGFGTAATDPLPLADAAEAKAAPAQWPATVAAPARAPAAVVSQAQVLLADLGYDPGPADGIEGERTAAAVRAFQAAAGLEADGRIIEPLVAALAEERRQRLVLPAQERLRALGYDPGPVDGQHGPRSQAAVRAFQADAGLPPDGRLTPALLDRLAAASPEPSGIEADAPPIDTAAGTELFSIPSPDSAMQDDTEEDGVLHPGDRVRVKLFAPDAAMAEAEVGTDGLLAVPGVGVVQAEGLRLRELEEKIAVKLLENYLRGLQVSVDLAAGAGPTAAASVEAGPRDAD